MNCQRLLFERAGGPDTKWGDELGFGLVVPSFYPLTGSIVTGRYKPPRVNPTRGAPSFLSDPVDCNSGILSSMGAVK